MNAHTHMHTQTHTHTHTCTHAHTHTTPHMHIHTCTHECTHSHAHTHTKQNEALYTLNSHIDPVKSGCLYTSQALISVLGECRWGCTLSQTQSDGMGDPP